MIGRNICLFQVMLRFTGTCNTQLVGILLKNTKVKPSSLSDIELQPNFCRGLADINTRIYGRGKAQVHVAWPGRQCERTVLEQERVSSALGQARGRLRQ